ncbi:hypothetical protein BDW71DRAFT_189467 [Aspergillus fruticulosus]
MKGVLDALVQVVLGNDGDTALDVAGLGESDKGAVLDVKNAVGLEDWAEHGLDNDRGLRVGDEARLLVKLASEEINTSVSPLVSQRGAGDADDLARTALEDKNVADADEVGRDRNGLRGSGNSAAGLDNANILLNAVTVTNWASFVSDNYFFAVVVVMVTMVVMKGVRDAVDSAFHTTTEGVVVTVVIVVTHLASVGVINYSSGLKNLDLVAGRSRGRDTLYTDLTVGVRVSAGDVEGLSLVLAVVTDNVRRRRAAGDVRGALVRTFEGLYGSLGATVGLNVVGWLITTAILVLGSVELVLKSPVVGLLLLLVVVLVERRRSRSRGGLFAVAFTSEFYLGITGLLHAFVDNGPVVTSAIRATFDVKIDFFLSVDFGVGERGRGSSIFPFDVRSANEVDFSLYSLGSKSSLRNSVTPVRRREDTEGDGDAGVKVQVGCPLSVFSRISPELLRITTRKMRQEKTFNGEVFLVEKRECKIDLARALCLTADAENSCGTNVRISLKLGM